MFPPPGKSSLGGGGSDGCAMLALGHFTAWLLQGQQQKGLGRWMRLIAIARLPSSRKPS